MANGQVLGEAIGATPKADIGAMLTGTPVERGARAREQLPALMQGKVESQADIKRREIDIEQEQLQKGAQAQAVYGEGLRKFDEFITEQERPAGRFEAPTVSASDYAANAAMRLVTGLAMGGIAKTSAIGQLKAIRAMQDAEESNQMERFEQARREFNQAEKQREDFNTRLRQRVERLREGLKTDRELAMIQAKLISAETRDGMIEAQVRAGNLQGALTLAERMLQQSDQLTEQLRREEQARAQAQEAARRAEEAALRRAAEARSLEELRQTGQTQREAQRQAGQIELEGLRATLRPPAGAARQQADQEKRQEARDRTNDILTNLQSAYAQLQQRGAIVDTDQNAIQNLKAAVASSAPAQYAQGWLGTESQSIRQTIYNTRPLLLATLKDALGLGAKSLDSNAELNFYLQASTDPSRDLQSNLSAIRNLRTLLGYYQQVAKDVDTPEMYQAAVESFGNYEPQKYEYRVQDGEVLRRLRQDRPQLEPMDGQPQ
jgi:hypothetical protein